MKILNNKEELLAYIQENKAKNLTIGFAPTMGALHEGHLSLYKKARKENDVVVSSIFVNPTQFNNPTDLEKYPRTIEKDLELLREIKNVDAVYLPKIEDIYPNGLERKSYDFDGLEKEMEGKSRPGHFDGVGTVVEELFRQIQPDNAYFGEKDFQQLMIIKKLVEKLNLSINIVGMPIFREENGLAMSSRNMRLSHDERGKAKIIFETLHQAKQLFLEGKNISEIQSFVEAQIRKSSFELEYFIIADEETLKEVQYFEGEKKYRAFIVVLVGEVRLIDNIAFY
ncbi:MAG: pantoate--beta-alanine ligase [Flavobacteriaceae bacterium]|nr:pantoate--beta-alanine ligase [Flavobacteriaceae bacterium]